MKETPVQTKALAIPLDYFGAASATAVRKLQRPNGRAELREAFRELKDFARISKLAPGEGEELLVIACGTNRLGREVLVFVYELDVEILCGGDIHAINLG